MGHHPTRGWIHETRLLRKGEHGKACASEMQGVLYALGCTVVTQVAACRSDESANGLEMLKDLKIRSRKR
jgi:hypothetical protein